MFRSKEVLRGFWAGLDQELADETSLYDGAPIADFPDYAEFEGCFLMAPHQQSTSAG